MLISKDIEAFLNICRECEKKYVFEKAQILNCDKATTDFLHSLELDNLSYSERAKLTTKEKENLKLRRKSKDIVEELEPLYHFIQNNKNAINLLTQTLGKVRKAEQYHQDRTYKKRIPDNKK